MYRGMLQAVLQFPRLSHHTTPHAEVCCKMCCNSLNLLSTQDQVPRYVASCVAIPLSISPHKTMLQGMLQDVCCNSPSHLTTQEHIPRDVAKCDAIPLSISPHQTKWDGWIGQCCKIHFIKAPCVTVCRSCSTTPYTDDSIFVNIKKSVTHQR